MDKFFPEVEISAEQAEVMARGLFAVARAEGGIHEREKTLLMSFYADVAEGSGSRSLSALEHAPDVSPSEIASALTSKAHALLFVKTCILMAYADNSYGGKERDVIEGFARALGLGPEQIAELEQDVKSYLLSSLVRLANTEAVAAVARELGGSKPGKD
jgi:tellurite resistance protein